MLSNKSQFILSKIGIPLFGDSNKHQSNDETRIFFFKKDNILTLHANSVDDYSEKEMKLLEAIVYSIRGPNISATKGSIFASHTQPIEIHQFSEGEKLKAIIIFSSSMEPFIKISAIFSPSLEEMLSEKSLKKNLWQKLKSFQTT
jgi:DNA polymerase III psi subunit